MACNNILRYSKVSPIINSKYVRHSSHSALKLVISEVPSLKFHQHLSRHNYSTLLSFRQPAAKRYLYALSNTIHSKSFISTNGDSDKYNVVINDPSQSAGIPADFSSHITKSLDAVHSNASAVTVDASSMTDIATPLTNELASAAVQLAEPTFASLGLANWTPVGLVQMFLEYLHVTWDMPWWVAIAASTVVVRILLFPVLIKTQRNAINMSNYMPQVQYLQAKFGEARRAGNTMEASKYANELMMYMKEHNISPLKSALMPMLQAPVFVSFFLGLRGMAKAPVQSMEYGGILWAPDLTIPDPYYITPVVACGTLYIVLKIGAESGVKLENLKMMKYVMQALPVVALPFCINFPAAVVYYWVTTNFCTLFFVSILKIPSVRKTLNLPVQQKVDPKFVLPKKGFIDGVKDSFEDQKVMASIEERRRMDEMRFLKAGTGPVPRTYSYDPTKPRPSNAAVSAKKNQS